MTAHVREVLSITPAEKTPGCRDSGFFFDFPQETTDLLRLTLDACGWLDGRIYLVVSRKGEVLAAAEAALSMHAASSGIISVRSGRLHVADPDCQDRLARFLQIGADQDATLVIKCGAGGQHCILRGVALDNNRVCVTIKFVRDISKPKLADPEFVFGLTPKEANVVRELFAGARMQDIADKLEISINTVRVHIRHVYEKIGVSSREDLWRILMPYKL